MVAAARRLLVATIVMASVAVGCNRRATVDAVPIGSAVQLTKADGALIEGTLTGRDAAAVTVAVGAATKSIARSDIADVRVADGKTPGVPPGAKFREVTVPESTVLAIRFETTVDSASNHANDPVHAVLAEPIVVRGVEAAPVGSALEGIVASAEPSGRVKGRADIAVRFDGLVVGSERYGIEARVSREAAAGTGRDAETIGIPAAGGAVLGAILGGKKGAAIGAAAGGGAGTAVVLSTPGKEVSLESGNIVHAEIGRSIDVRVPIE